MGYVSGIGDCPLAAGEAPGRCGWCGDALTGRRTRWCSDECGKAIWREHQWSSARSAALLLAGYRCSVCERPSGWRPPDLVAFLGLLKRLPLRGAPPAFWRAERVLPQPLVIEVNHKRPIKGGHSRNGCHHHVDGLEVLCRDCHRIVTKAQRAGGWVEVDAREVVRNPTSNS